MPRTARAALARATVIDAGGTAVRAASIGHGPALLVCSGLASPLGTWAPLAERMPDLRIIAFDVPGIGGSPQPCRPVRIGGIAALATHVLDHFGVGRAHVLGYSWGGAVAQHLAWRRPDRVDHLVLAATSVGLGAVPAAPWAVASVLADLAAGAAAREAPPHTWPFGVLGQLGALGTWSSLPWAHRITAPTLVLAGAEDLLVPALNAHVLAAAIRPAKVRVLPGLGHRLFDAAAVDAVVPHLRAFLDAQAAS